MAPSLVLPPFERLATCPISLLSLKVYFLVVIMSTKRTEELAATFYLIFSLEGGATV